MIIVKFVYMRARHNSNCYDKSNYCTCAPMVDYDYDHMVLHGYRCMSSDLFHALCGVHARDRSIVLNIIIL